MCPDEEDDQRASSKLRSIGSSISGAATAGRQWATDGFARARTSVSDAAQRSAKVAGDAAGTIAAGADAAFARARVGADKAKGGVLKTAALASNAMSDGAAAVASFLALPELLKWSEQITKSTATITTKHWTPNI